MTTDPKPPLSQRLAALPIATIEVVLVALATMYLLEAFGYSVGDPGKWGASFVGWPVACWYRPAFALGPLTRLWRR